MSRARYQIADEPMPSTLSRFVVDPFWPVLACMVVGGIPGLAWLAFNGFALGSPTRVRELSTCLAGVFGALLVLVLVGIGKDAGMISAHAAKYLVLLALVSKLGFAYMAGFLQQRALELHEHYGGSKANGVIPLLFAVFLLRPAVASALAGSSLLQVLFA
ncbi:MAG: hypothetical protein HYU78_10060 [Rhodocyclales bacterium]|nr:hypothetical protein [Rhodocyclales bacterium]